MPAVIVIINSRMNHFMTNRKYRHVNTSGIRQAATGRHLKS